MCKKISTLIVSVILFVMQVYVHASVGDEGTYEGFDYTIISDKSVVITKYTGSDTEVNVPEKIGEYTVTRIGNIAFQDKAMIEKITLPETIVSI